MSATEIDHGTGSLCWHAEVEQCVKTVPDGKGGTKPVGHVWRCCACGAALLAPKERKS